MLGDMVITYSELNKQYIIFNLRLIIRIIYIKFTL